MRWFERGSTDGAQRAKFVDISQGATPRRIPSWVPGRAEHERRAESSLRPPKLPSEFVNAVRHELDQEYLSHARASLPPPDAGARRSELPQAPVAASPASVAQNPVVAAPVEPPEPSVDPALIQAFEQAVMLFASERERVLSETAGQIAELAVLIARRVIGRELSLDPTLVRGIVREGLDALGQHQRVLVRLGAGFAVAESALSQDLERLGETFEIHVDPMLEDYGCIVETDLGQVDESIDSRLGTLLQGVDPEPEAQ